MESTTFKTIERMILGGCKDEEDLSEQVERKHGAERAITFNTHSLSPLDSLSFFPVNSSLEKATLGAL